MKEKFDKWLEAKFMLDRYKKMEMELRKEIVEHYCEAGTDDNSAEIVFYFDSEGNELTPSQARTFGGEVESYTLKALAPSNMKFDFEGYNLMFDELDKNEQDVVVVKQSVSMRAFNSLPEDSPVRELATYSPAAPKLSIDCEEL